MKKCFYCGGRIVSKKIQHIHHWGKKFVFFNDLPAEVCTQCGETYLSPDVMKQIDKVTSKPQQAQKKMVIPVFSFAHSVH